jgi:hypothetical protein
VKTSINKVYTEDWYRDERARDKKRRNGRFKLIISRIAYFEKKRLCSRIKY